MHIYIARHVLLFAFSIVSLLPCDFKNRPVKHLYVVTHQLKTAELNTSCLSAHSTIMFCLTSLDFLFFGPFCSSWRAASLICLWKKGISVHGLTLQEWVSAIYHQFQMSSWILEGDLRNISTLRLCTVHVRFIPAFNAGIKCSFTCSGPETCSGDINLSC